MCFKVHIGVRGYVLNTSGMGISGSNISVAGIDHIITAWIYGDYYRLLLPGTYNITASALGWLPLIRINLLSGVGVGWDLTFILPVCLRYLPSTINNITVTEGKATLLNFVLQNLSEEALVSGVSVTTVAYQSTERVLDTQQASTPEPPVKSHHSYSEMEAYLQQISSVYSSHAQLYSIGQSVLGRKLYIMKISSNLATEEPGSPLAERFVTCL